MPQITAFTDIAYADNHPRCRLDLFRPADNDRAPLLILIHGGGWSGGERTQFLPHCVRLAEAGFAAATIGYRLLPDAVWPEIAYDVARGTALLTARADEFRIDASRAITWGSSAGGHLALAMQALAIDWVRAGVVAALPEIIGTVALCPAVRVPISESPAPHHVALLNGHPTEDVSPHAMDPQRFKSVLAVHGDADDLIPLAHVDAFVKNLVANKIGARLETLPGAGHGYGYRLMNEHASKALELGSTYARALFAR